MSLFYRTGLSGFFLLVLSVLLIPVAASATTAPVNPTPIPITNCEKITKLGTYALSNNLTSTAVGNSCLEITGLPAGIIVLQGGGYTIQSSQAPIFIHDNNANTAIYFSGFKFVSTTPNNILPIENSSQTSVIESSSNSYTSTDTTLNDWIQVSNVGSFYSQDDVLKNVWIEILNSKYGSVVSDTITVANNVNIGTGILLDNTPAYVANDTIMGAPSSLSGYTINLDDGVVLQCDHDMSSPCYAGMVQNVTVSEVYDAGVEFVGPFSGGVVQNNTMLQPLTDGIGCYHRCALDRITMANNKVVSTPLPPDVVNAQTALVLIGDEVDPTPSEISKTFFTNNIFSGNSISGIVQATDRYSFSNFSFGPSYGMAGANTISNNDFGSPTYVEFTYLPAPAVTDGGGNVCASGAPDLACGPSVLQSNYVKTDLTTLGNWSGVYGADGFYIPNGPSQAPSYGSVTVYHDLLQTWSTNTPDIRALHLPGGPPGPGPRIATAYTTSPGQNVFYIDIYINDNKTHQVAIYLDDWDNNGGGRLETVQSIAGGKYVDTRGVENFYVAPRYLVYNFKGPFAQLLVSNNNPKTNAVVSGIFFDPVH